jgi:hypothetical protein
MSIVNIRAALESKLNNMENSLPTAWENAPYTPITGTAYQRVWLLVAEPGNPTFGDDYYREQGILQVTLYYPLQTGSGTAAARADLIRSTFKRGTSMTSGGNTVIVYRTPEISNGRVEGDRWALPVRIRWYAGII